MSSILMCDQCVIVGMSSTLTQTVTQMESVHSFVSYHGIADQRIRTMRSNWKIPNSRLSRSASLSDVNAVTPNGTVKNGYHANGLYTSIPPPLGNETISEETGISTYDSDHSSPSNALRRESYAGFNSEPKPTRRRPSYKRLRSRKHAVKRVHSGQSPYASPCELLEQVVDYHSEEADDDCSTSLLQYMVSVLMIQYMTWTEQLYKGFQGCSTKHRFWMWALACVITTLAAIGLLTLLAFLLLHAIDVVVLVTAASVKFLVLLISMSFVCCCAVLILNYKGDH